MVCCMQSHIKLTFTQIPVNGKNRKRDSTAKMCINSQSFVSFNLFQVGTGFSFTSNDAGYVTNETTVGNDLVMCAYFCFV